MVIGGGTVQLTYRLTAGQVVLSHLVEVQFLVGQPSLASSADRILPCEGSGQRFDSFARRQIADLDT